jgi:predicted secreted protein
MIFFSFFLLLPISSRSQTSSIEKAEVSAVIELTFFQENLREFLLGAIFSQITFYYYWKI